MSARDHIKRWSPAFESEPWWETHCALYEGPGHDWEGADVALEQMVYALAKARALPTEQTCPRCGTIVDEVSSLGKHRDCQHCEHADAIEDEIAEASDRLRRLEAEARYLALSPDERARVDAENKRVVQLAMHGLLTRDVQ